MTTNHPYSDPAPEPVDPHYPHGGPEQPEPAPAAYPQPDPYAPAGQQQYGQYAHYAQYAQYPYFGQYAPPAAPHRPRHTWRLGAGIAALTAAALVGGIAIGDAVSGSSGPVSGSGSGSQTELIPGNPGPGAGGSGGSGPGGVLNPGGGTSTSVSLATAQQKVGVVTIVSTLRYQNAQSAGTGMIVSSDGEVITNNHVINGATSVVVTVASTGKSYRADVVGTAPSEDVAVLQLRNASGLKTANVADNADVKVGDSVVGVGNAGGTGTLRASNGKVTALDQTITASDDGSGTNTEKLNGLIEVDAPIISGDSGGPLYDSSGEVIGMDTAASANPRVTKAYAIPIEDALSIANQIESGKESSTIHIGLPAFLGVGVDDTTSGNGAAVSSLLDGGPAAAAGITEGSVITHVGNTRVTSADSLKAALHSYNPGDKAKISWTDPAGGTHSATVTLATGPAD